MSPRLLDPSRFASYTDTRPKSASMDLRRESISGDRTKSRRGSVGDALESRRRSISSSDKRSRSADKRRGSIPKV